ncbi:hypothetical protein [Mycobacterium sp. 155]|nr:hypothetical protein [Mycobacterium sp. 155]
MAESLDELLNGARIEQDVFDLRSARWTTSSCTLPPLTSPLSFVG